jgi:hypothetical protein
MVPWTRTACAAPRAREHDEEPMDHYLFYAPAKDRNERRRRLADAADGRSGEAVVCVG